MVRAWLLAICATLAVPAAAAPLRVATFDVELGRDGPGQLLGELTTKPKEKARSAVAVIRAVRPDVLVLQGIDDDLRGRTLDAFAALLAEGPEGIDYPHRFHAPVNAGIPSGLDLDGDGRTMGWEDALGWGKYPGHGGMAVLSRLPLGPTRTFRTLRWAELPDARLPTRPDGAPWLDAAARAALPLSSRSHWDLPVRVPDGGTLRLLTAKPTPPLFDGPEGLNRLRNHDEISFWERYLDGAPFRDDDGVAAALAAGPVVLLGDLNLDPADGAGEHAAIRRLLAHPRLRDPRPASAGAAAAATAQGGANRGQTGPAALDTADWRDDPGPGNLRVDYVLPSADLEVIGAGVFWPGPDDPQAALLAGGSSHRLVWVDLRTP